MTAEEARWYAAAELEAAGVPDARLDAMLLLEWSTGIQRSHILAYPEEELDEASEKRFFEAVGRRKRREPLQYITGSQEFMGLDFMVDARVLIPRQDTETLVCEALSFLSPGMEVLDLCTGSGCIILSLCAKCAGIQGTGSDFSENALEVARGNSGRLDIAADFVLSDLFDKIEGRYDVIVSNPPYIESGGIPSLMDEVRLYEPLSALDGHQDGLYFYRRIAKEAPSFLKDDGRIFLEIGCGQGADVSGMLREAGFEDIKVVRDLCGHDRVVEGRYV